MDDFRKAIERAINRHSMERGSNSPDFLLAQYLTDCLAAFDKALTRREAWYGRTTEDKQETFRDPHTGAAVLVDHVLPSDSVTPNVKVERRGTALALNACRRLITGHLSRMGALDPQEEGPQITLPGLERVASHTAYPVPIANTNRFKIVARHTRDATLAQHQACLLLKQTNTRRCIAREAGQQRIIDLLDSSGCDSLREWERRFAHAVA